MKEKHCNIKIDMLKYLYYKMKLYMSLYIGKKYNSKGRNTASGMWLSDNCKRVQLQGRIGKGNSL